MQALVQASQAGQIPPVAVVMSNTPNSPGLAWARNQGLATEVVSEKAYSNRFAHDEALASVLRYYGVTLVCLAGYMRIVGEPLLTAYPNHILNIHPSLLPRFGGPGMVGKRVHQAVLAAGEVTSGCSVHVVTAGVDEGPVVAQHIVPVYPSDTVEALASRVLVAEHQCYPQAVATYRQQLVGAPQLR